MIFFEMLVFLYLCQLSTEFSKNFCINDKLSEIPFVKWQKIFCNKEKKTKTNINKTSLFISSNVASPLVVCQDPKITLALEHTQ